MSAKIDIYTESWRIIEDLETTGKAVGPSICRDTVNHYYEMSYPDTCVVTDRAYVLDANYAVKKVVIENNSWSLR